LFAHQDIPNSNYSDNMEVVIYEYWKKNFFGLTSLSAELQCFELVVKG
jgi:hypothetical protein